MGYYKSHTLYIETTKEKIEDVLNKIKEWHKENEDVFYPFFYSEELDEDNDFVNEETYLSSNNVIYEINLYDEATWYDNVREMIKLSGEFPDILFTLECIGEDGESWNEYYYKGKTVTHYAVIPPFDIHEFE